VRFLSDEWCVVPGNEKPPSPDPDVWERFGRLMSGRRCGVRYGMIATWFGEAARVCISGLRWYQLPVDVAIAPLPARRGAARLNG